MKTNSIRLSLTCACLPFLWLPLPLTASTGVGDSAADFASTVPFETGMTEFAAGDSISIQRVTGTSSTIRAGDTYCVEGTYTLASKAEADLALFATVTSSAPTPTESSQIVRVKKGSGTFRLVKPMREDGYLHVSFYPVPGGSSFGGVYFGTGKWLLPKEGWSAIHHEGRVEDSLGSRSSPGQTASITGPNRAMFEYLGDPIMPPADMAAAYTREGLIAAIQSAARKAGITVKRVEIEDSEYPFLVGLVCREGDFSKLTTQLRKLPDYEYCGCTSSPTHSAFNMVPYRVFPRGASERIQHRTGLRVQMFFDKLLNLE